MGCMMWVRLSSFFTSAAVASRVGFYYLYKDYRIAHKSISRQLKAITESLDARITSQENLKETKNTSQLECSE